MKDLFLRSYLSLKIIKISAAVYNALNVAALHPTTAKQLKLKCIHENKFFYKNDFNP
jgi:hypothetical protein